MCVCVYIYMYIYIYIYNIYIYIYIMYIYIYIYQAISSCRLRVQFIMIDFVYSVFSSECFTAGLTNCFFFFFFCISNECLTTFL